MREQMTVQGMVVLAGGLVLFWSVVAAALLRARGRRRSPGRPG